MNSFLYPIIAAIGFGFYNFFVGRTENRITPAVGTLILSITAATIALIGIFFQRFLFGKVLISPLGIKYALLAGIATGIAEIFYFIAFTKNPNVSVILPIVFTLTIVTGVILGLVFNNETLSGYKFLGIGLSLVALYLLTK